MTSAHYHPGPAFDVLGKLRATEAAISRVKALHGQTRDLISYGRPAVVTPVCSECAKEAPCPTLRAIRGDA